jgi:hypothetical protein
MTIRKIIRSLTQILSVVAVFLLLITGPASAENAAEGWVLYAEGANAAVNSFSGNWTVPAAPSETSHDQTIYIWLGLQPKDGSGIGAVLQPVLAWEQGSWSVTNWFVTNGGGPGTQRAASYPVQEGDELTGTITQVSSGDGSYTYSSTFAVNGESLAAKYNLTNVTTTYPLAAPYIVLEAYNASSCADYPDATKVSFTDLDLKFVRGPQSAEWNAPNNDPTDSYCNTLAPVIVTNSNSDGVVDIYFDFPNSSS